MYKTDLLQQRVALARRTVNLGVSPAGDAAAGPHPGLDEGDAFANCTAFVPYVLGLEAGQDETGEPLYDAKHIYADATGRQRIFQRIEAPAEGCLLVAPPTSERGGKVAVVTQLKPLMGVDCDGTNLPEPIIEHDLSEAAAQPECIFCLLTSDLQ